MWIVKTKVEFRLSYMKMATFNLVDDEAFAQFLENGSMANGVAAAGGSADAKYNYCPDCDIPMALGVNEYSCAGCGRSIEWQAEGRNIVATNVCRKRFYGIAVDPARAQKKAILEQLTTYNNEWKGNKFPPSILCAAADQYIAIQKSITKDITDPETGQIQQKKFVHRKGIKDEILASLVYFESIRMGIVRKKKDIAIFMRLQVDGFARGENILRDLHAEGKIELPVNDEPVEGYVDRYLEILNLGDASGPYGKFIIDIVEESERRNICMSSQLSSKIVGAIWIAIRCNKLPITSAQLERATDNTKKNTFMKFYKAVFSPAGTTVFRSIFLRHKVPFELG